MKKQLSLLLTASCLFLASTTSAWATSFTFEGTFGDIETPKPGTAEEAAYNDDKLIYGPDEVLASADMDITVSGNTVTAVLHNTSPTLLSDGRSNASGITGFGFNLTDPLPSLSSWSLEAYDSLLNVVDISATNDWKLDNKMAGIKVDYLPDTLDENIQGALYNPDAIGSSALAALPNYFTTATLTLNFDDVPLLDFSGEWSPFVRMMNVGPDGEYSLKMAPVPEPATMMLFGTGLAGLAGTALRRKKKK